jgi:hypothetical protein
LEGDAITIHRAIAEREDLLLLAWTGAPAELAAFLLEDQVNRRAGLLAANVGRGRRASTGQQTEENFAHFLDTILRFRGIRKMSRESFMTQPPGKK